MKLEIGINAIPDILKKSQKNNPEGINLLLIPSG